MNLILIGYRGSGKTTVGELLARRLGWHFIDLDDMIVRKAGKNISEIFAAEGEAGFRKREREACEQLRKSKHQVIAFGGGTLVDNESRTLAKRIGKLIWLRAPAAVLWRRIKADSNSEKNRPGLTPIGGLDEVEAVLQQREQIYENAAVHIVDTTSDMPEQVAEAIEMWFRANDSEAG